MSTAAPSPVKQPPVSATPPNFIYIVIGTAALMTFVFFTTLAALLFVLATSSPMWEKVLMAFITAGSNAMSFLFGVLVNTHVMQQGSDDKPADPFSPSVTATVSSGPINPTDAPSSFTVSSGPMPSGISTLVVPQTDAEQQK